MKKILVVGGGAGGLELITKLSRTLGRKGRAQLTLVDKARTHVWKPLLHEVAAGVIDKNSDGVDYPIHAARHGYRFQLGEMTAVDVDKSTIHLDEIRDDDGEIILPERQLAFDILVIAIGSVSNDFSTPGVRKHCFMLDSLAQAERFHKALLNRLLQIQQLSDQSATLKVAIVGGGATGTELAAQLHHVAGLARHYGMPAMSTERLEVSIIEAGERILPALPERISAAARRALSKLGIRVLENTRVAKATEAGFVTADGNCIDADLMVWAAGVKAPDFLSQMAGVETNKAQQIKVNAFLQSPANEHIYVIGDSCAFEQEDGRWVPPRAQAAHQMASTAADNIRRQLDNRALTPYRYVDYGSLVHLSRYSTVGSLMGKLSNSSMFVEGKLAKLVYVSLYNMHQFAIHGWRKGVLVLLARKLSNLVGPKLKLH